MVPAALAEMSLAEMSLLILRAYVSLRKPRAAAWCDHEHDRKGSLDGLQ
jgi:hypothetical protein